MSVSDLIVIFRVIIPLGKSCNLSGLDDWNEDAMLSQVGETISKSNSSTSTLVFSHVSSPVEYHC